ncbi:tetratricopeptide repeat protein 30A [Selaginella moellendorffii]|nr:tetratricopeptide repeat protein 30A [Selaginella moellendorffii]|eukprot:XP_002990744.2 tetratricopeptide repeat protein 30A [Selaginella moellendorffii]
MRKIEKEEERAHYEAWNASWRWRPQELHVCIVNLVIGTLYCAKQNFEFGISRIIRSLEPYGKKLEADTWFYAKRCFLALVDSLAKQMIVLKDATYADIDDFLDAADSQGKTVYTSVESPGEGQNSNTVSREARLLKRMFLKIRE